MTAADEAGSRHLWAWVLAVFTVALALRLLHLAGLEASWDGTHLFGMARGDEAHHWYEALEIVGENPLLRNRVLWKGPGYSYFLAGLIALFGSSPAALRWPLAVLGAANCAALVLLARRALPQFWSVAAGLLAAAHGVLILFDGELLFPTLLVSLNLPALWLLSGPRPGFRAHAGAGSLFGLAALVHPVYVAPALALALRSVRVSPRHALVSLLATATVIAPVSLSNLVLRGQPMLISWNGGINVYVGNHPAFDQYSGNRTSAWARILQTPIDAGIESEHERDRFYYGLALKQAVRAPLDTIRTLLRKSVLLVSPVEYASNIRLYELREYSPVLAATLGRWGPLWLPFGIWGPTAILGIVLWLRERRPLPGVLAVWSLGLAATIVLSFNTARYRAPLVFFGCIWVAYALGAGWRAWRARRWRALGVGGAAWLALVAILAGSAVQQRGFPLPLEWSESLALRHEGKPDEAVSWAERALARAPRDPELRLAVADLFRRIDRGGREREQLRRLLAMPDLEPDAVVTARHRLAKSHALDGRIEDARREMQAALSVGVDATDWRGRPYYRLGLGALTACWLRLELAGMELAAGERARGQALTEGVRSECPAQGRLEERLLELEVRSILADEARVP